MVDSNHVSSARSIVEYLRQTDDYSKLVPAWIHLSTLEDLGESSSELAKILVEIGEGESIMIESNPDLPRTLPEGPELGRTAVDLLKEEQTELMVRALSLSGDHTLIGGQGSDQLYATGETVLVDGLYFLALSLTLAFSPPAGFLT